MTQRNASGAPAISQVRNVIANWGAFLVGAAGGLVLSPFVVSHLGTTAFGIWVIASSLTGSMNILDMGIRSAVTRFVARANAREDHAEASRVAATARVMLHAIAGLAALISVLLAAVAPGLFHLPEDMAHDSQVVVLLTGAAVAIVLNTGLYSGTLTALQRLDIVGTGEAMFECLRLGLTFLVISLGGGIVAMGVLALLSAGAKYAYYRRAARRIYPEFSPALRRPSGADIREIAGFSVFSTLIYSSLGLASQATTWLVAGHLGAAMAAFYSVGATLPTYAAALNRPIALTVHPRASRLDALNDEAGLQTVIRDTGRYSGLVLLPVVLTFLLRGDTFIRIWMGEEFALRSGPVLHVFAIGLLFSTVRHVMQAAFVGSGRQESLGGWYIAEFVVVLALGLVLIDRWGVAGGAAALVIPGVFMAVVVMPALVWRRFSLPPYALIASLWLRPFAAMAAFAIASAYVDRAWPADGYIAFFSQVALLLPLAALGAYAIGLNQGERTLVRARLKALLAKAGR